MAWVSPKVYAILKNSEEGKDILEGIAEKDQAEVDKEVDAFFGKGGKGYSNNADYQKAKEEHDDEYDEDYERSWGPRDDDDEDDDNYKEDDLSIQEDKNKKGEFVVVDKEGNVVANGLYSREEAKKELKDILANPEGKMSKPKEEKTKEHDGYETDDTPAATRYKKKDEFNNDIIILKMKDSGKYKVFKNGGFIGKSPANGDDFNSFEEAENALNKELEKDVFEEGEEVEVSDEYGQPYKANILRRMPQKELDDLGYSLNPHAPGGYYEIEYEGFGGDKRKKVVWTRRIDRKK